MNFGMDTPPDTLNVSDILLLPGMMVFFGALIWVIAYNRIRLGEKAPWRWVCMVPMAFGTYLGLLWVFQLKNSLYRMGLIGNKIVMGHYLALIIPLVAIAVIFVLEFVLSRNKSRYGRAK